MKLLIVDDDLLIQKSLSITLAKEKDIEVVATASNGAESLILCEEKQPDIILMDIRMPQMDGIAATRIIKERFPFIRIMMLTTFDDGPNIQQALSAGADGYLIKTDKIANIAGKLRVLNEGISVLGQDVLQKIVPTSNPLLETLTQREHDIARLVARGMSNKEIADQLFLSQGTVRNNISVIMEKLEVENRTQLGLIYLNK